MKKILTNKAVQIIFILSIVLFLSGSANPETQPITSLDQLAQPGITIGVGVDTPVESLLAEDCPDAKLIPYSDILLAYADVASGRIDACVSARKEMEFAVRHGFSGVRLLEENYSTASIAVGISPVSRIPDLTHKLNDFIKERKADGTLDDMYDRWVIRDDETMPEIPPAEDPAFTLRVGTTGTVMPYSYHIGTELAGYDIELAHRFAAWLGADLECKEISLGGIIAAAEQGSIDCIMSNLFYTEEKNETIPFSDVLFEIEFTAMVRDNGQASDASSAPTSSVDQLNGKRIGIHTGTSFDTTVKARLPDATLDYYNTQADLVAALTGHKIDAFVADEPAAKILMRENDQVTYLPDYLDDYVFAFVFPKGKAGEALRDQFNAFIEPLQADGTLESLAEKWFGEDESQKTMPDTASFSGENGKLSLATQAGYPPFEYVRDGAVVGYDIELAAMFCQANGYGLKIVDMNFDGVLPSLQTGNCDFAASAVTITPEREQSVLFSLPNFSGGTVMVVLKSEVNEGGFFLEGIISSFNKTFLREHRWRLFLDGVVTTLVITLLSIFAGTALGFIVFVLCRNGNPAANQITRFCLWLVQGMPMVVLLMILYYVIFGSFSISGIVVAVIGFTLTFGSSVIGLLKMGVGAVDNGQYEAAYALGYSNRRTFYKIILPQALPHVLPAYKGEIIGLIKATSVVGYIAVQDLTKMGDIVRSRTYEAFFPLIAVTIIYFVLEGLLRFVVSRINICFNPKRRKPADILKGVKTNDQD